MRSGLSVSRSYDGRRSDLKRNKLCGCLSSSGLQNHFSMSRFLFLHSSFTPESSPSFIKFAHMDGNRPTYTIFWSGVTVFGPGSYLLNRGSASPANGTF